MTSIPTPLISRLCIENFKSIKSAQLDFSPLTVLVGANSAGKSSILQAIFLLSQIIRGHSQSRLINLNGAELQLGTFTDIKHSSGRGRTGTIQFEIEVNVEDPRRAGARIRPPAGDLPHAPEKMQWSLSLAQPGRSQIGTARLRKVTLAAERPEGEIRAVLTPPTMRDQVEQDSPQQRLAQLRPGSAFTRSIDAVKFFDCRLTGPFQLEQDSDNGSNNSGELFIGLLDNALPQKIFTEQPDTAALANTWLQGVATQLRRDLQAEVRSKLGDWERGFDVLRTYTQKTGSARVPTTMIVSDYAIGQWVEEQKESYRRGTLSDDRIRLLESLRGWAWRSADTSWASTTPPDGTYGLRATGFRMSSPSMGVFKTRPTEVEVAEKIFPFFIEWVEKYDEGKIPRPAMPAEEGDEFLRGLTANTPEAAVYREEIAATLVDLLERKRAPRIQLEPLQTGFDDVARDLRERMSTSVSYLGPLREDPSPAYRPGEGGAIARLGVKGEYAVPELERYRSTFVYTALPPDSDDDSWPAEYFRDASGATSRTRFVRKTLGEAVDIWMNYLGVAKSIDVHGVGRAGIELDIVDQQTGAKRNLTNVGVGVSQLLPVVVLCLRAQPGDVVLIEQPELHLHPGPQQALADFLLAMSISGRQLVVETHSEYLINRLRLRIARDDADTVAHLIAIIYAERERGKTAFRSIQPNSYGSIDEWPVGFFDQAPKETEAILRSAMAKRKRQREQSRSDS